MPTESPSASVTEQSTGGPPPPAPTLAAPTGDAEIYGRSVTLVWHPLLAGQHHHVQLAADPGFDDVQFETTVGSENAVRVRWPERPEAGRRFWRVKCYRHGVWGPYSATGTFTLTGEASAPAPAPAPDSPVPHLVGVTSSREAAIALLVFLVGTALIVELALFAPVGSLFEATEAPTPPAFEATAASLEEMVGTAPAIEAGGRLFTRHCAACHGQQGGGGVGPNLTDPYWLHGGTNMDLYEVILNGVASQGMPAWDGSLSDREMAQLVAFIRSLEGTDPPDAKAPEGDPVALNE